MKRGYLIGLIVAVVILAAIIAAIIILRPATKTTPTDENQGVATSYADRSLVIQSLFAKASKKTTEQVTINIAREDGNFIKGIVNIKDGYEGIFLAAKQNGAWEIIWDGKTAYSCNDIEKYSIPKTISGCQ